MLCKIRVKLIAINQVDIYFFSQHVVFTYVDNHNVYITTTSKCCQESLIKHHVYLIKSKFGVNITLNRLNSNRYDHKK